MRDLDTLTTHEMNQEEWSEFRRRWIQGYAEMIVLETDTEEADAQEIAEIRFEDYVGQEGYTMRDMQVIDARESDAH